MSALAGTRHVSLPLHQRDSIGSLGLAGVRGTPLYHVLTFDAREPLVARAGQFAMVRSSTWGEAPLLPRPMSLLTAGERPSILIKVIGEGTRRMAHASSGEEFQLLAPLGKPWSPPPAGKRALLVAGGVGVAPLLFFAREMARGTSPIRPLALYGGRTDHDLPLDVELAEVAELKVATEDGSRGTAGRVTALLEAELAAAKKPVVVYTCGPEAMMAAVVKICEAAKVECEVSLETPMACGYGVCLGCPVPKKGGGFLYACTEGPCVDAAKIDWTRGHVDERR